VKSPAREAREMFGAFLAELTIFLLLFGVAKLSFATFRKIIKFVAMRKAMKKFQSNPGTSKSDQTSFDKNLYYDDFY